MAAKIPFGSVEYLHMPVSLDEDSEGVSLADVDVEVAILAEGGQPTATGVVWHATSVTGTAEELTARYLLDGTRARGRYDVWVRLDADVEKVLRKAGVLTIT